MSQFLNFLLFLVSFKIFRTIQRQKISVYYMNRFDAQRQMLKPGFCSFLIRHEFIPS
jgi:hypothetical protein